MRLLMASPSYAPVIGGTETAVRELTRALRTRGHVADVLTINMDAKWCPRWQIRESVEDGGRVVRWGAWNPLRGLRTPRLNRLAGRHVDGFVISQLQHLAMMHVLVRGGVRRLTRQYQVVHCHDETDLSLALAVRPHVMHLHTMSESLAIYRKRRLPRRLLTRCARAWLANSTDSAVKATSIGVPGGRMRVVPNGVDSDLFRPLPEHPREGLLFVGRLVPRKGLDVLLEALRLLRKPTSLRVAGVPADPEYAAHIATLARDVERAAGHRVDLLGPKTSAELSQMYRHAAVVVCPSRIEPFGIVALEAMSSGAAVLASRVDGLQEVIADGHTGVLSPPGDAQALSAHLDRLLADADLRRDLGRCAREDVLARFTWDRVAEQVERAYDELLP